MVFDGSCGHRPMIWRPSDMVRIRSYSIGDDGVCALCVEECVMVIAKITDVYTLCRDER